MRFASSIRRGCTLAFAATVGAGTLLAVAGPAGALPAQDTLPALSTAPGAEGAQIVDATGRTVLLRGVNVNQINDYAVNDPSKPTNAPISATDFQQMAAVGFNTVRLNIAWSALEPERGKLNGEYVDKIRWAVKSAAENGMYTVLDMHQDAWGKYIKSPAGTDCPSPLQPSNGWDGAPEWATITDGAATCNLDGIRETSPAVARAFQNFYDNRDGIRTALSDTWGRLVTSLGDQRGIAGYDLLNEPHVGEREPFAAADQIGRFYQEAIDTIRRAEAGLKIAPRLGFFEPSVLWPGFGIDAMPPQRYVDSPNMVFAPHQYVDSITTAIVPMTLEDSYDLAEAISDWYGAPMWSGEYGWFGEEAEDLPLLARYAATEDRHLSSGAFWVWKQACGDPHEVPPAPSSDSPLGSLASEPPTGRACPAYEPTRVTPGFQEILGRAYPRAVPGMLTEIDSDFAARTLRVAGHADGPKCGLDLWVPGGAKPVVDGVNARDLEVRKVDGGWRVAGCVDGDYEVSVR